MNTLLKFSYYIFGLLAILWEFSSLIYTRKIQIFVKEYRKTRKEKKEKNNLQKNYSSLHALYFVWVLVGLFSSQWLCFIALIITSLIFSPKNIVIRFLGSLISLVILIFIIINALHLHINTLELVKTFVISVIN